MTPSLGGCTFASPVIAAGAGEIPSEGLLSATNEGGGRIGGAGEGEAKPPTPGGVAPGGKGEAEGSKPGGLVAGKGGMKPGGGGKPGMPCTGNVGGGIPGGNDIGKGIGAPLGGMDIGATPGGRAPGPPFLFRDAMRILCCARAAIKSASGMTLYDIRGRFAAAAAAKAAVPNSASFLAFHSACAFPGTPSIPKISMS